MAVSSYARSEARRARTILTGSYVIAFALPIIGAVQSLVVLSNDGQSSASTIPVLSQFVEDLIPLVISVAAAAVAMRRAAKPPLALTRTDLGLRRPVDVSVAAAAWTSVMYVAVLTFAATVAQLLLDLFGVHQDTSTAPGDGLPVAIINSSWAGLMEEPILLGLTFALARRMRWRGSTLLALMIIMRIAFHLYYGPGSLFVVPWMCAAYVLYRRCPLLWPFVLGHGIFDVLQTLYNDGSPTVSRVGSIVEDVIAVIGLAVALRPLIMRLRSGGLTALRDVIGQPWQPWPRRRPGAPRCPDMPITS